MADPEAWGAVPKSTPEDWGAAEVKKPSGTADFFKSLPRGAVGGLGAGIESLPDDLAIPGATKAAQAAGASSRTLGQTLGLPGRESIVGAVEGVTGPLHKPETRAGRFGETIGEFLGNPLGYVGPGGPVGKVIGNTAAAVGSEAAGQAFAGGKGEGVARFLGGILGGSFPSILRMLNPSVVAPERQRALDVLKKEGIKPTVGQVTGSEAMRRAEGTLGTAVGAGGAGRREIDRIADEFTAAVNRRMGAKATRATPEVIEEARARIGGAFERTARDLRVGGTTSANQKYFDDIQAWTQDLLKEGLPNETTNRLIQQARNLAQGFVAGKPGEVPVMPGKTYQALTRHETPLARAIDDPDPNVGYYATRLRSILDDALEHTATGRGTQEGKGMRKALGELKEARRQWYNMLVISRAVSGPGEGAAAGHISPQKLRQILTSSDDRKIQYAAGRGDLSELAHAANEILAPIPTSQTAERALISSIPLGLGLGASHLAAGDIPGAVGLAGAPFAPGLAGRALLSKPVQGTKRGDWQPDWLVHALDAMPGVKEQTLRSLLLSQGQQGVPHYQEGGVSPGGQAVVGESGPEIVNLPPGSEVVPNHDIDSLLRMMGSGPAPPEAEPMTRALPGYEQRSPGELAMIRTQEATRPTRGRADITPEHAAQMLLAAGGTYAAPEQLLARAIAAAPKTMAGLLTTLGLTVGTQAGDKPFNWEDNNKDRTKEITAIEKRIQDRADKITQLGTTTTKSPPGTQKQVIENLTKLNAPDAPDTLRLVQLRAEQKSDREQALADEMERRQRETSLSKKYPGVFGGAALASPVFSYLTGKMPGSRIKNAAGAAAVGGLGGAVEGFGAAYAPTYLDLKLPSGADKEAAQARVRDPLYWLTEVAPIVGANALAGGLGAGRKNLSMRPKLGPQHFPPPKSPTGELPSPPTPPAPVSPPTAPPVSPAPSASPSGSSGPPTMVRSGITYELTSSGWRVKAGQPGGGRFMKKPPQWPSWLPKEGE